MFEYSCRRQSRPLSYYSRGIPRVLNLLCEHAMIRASCAERTQPVPASLINDVAVELQCDDVKPPDISDDVRSTFDAPPPETLLESPDPL